MLSYWIKNLSGKNRVTEEEKEIIVGQIGGLLCSNFCPALFLPFDEINHLENAIERYVSLEEWLDEIIFCAIPDESKSRKRHILTRKMLIKTVRDKDGGAHVDKQLQEVPEYFLSKQGITIGKYPHKTISTKDYNLWALRKLGYEILNSPDISKFVKN